MKPAFIYEERKITINRSHPKLNMYIFLYLYFEIKRLSRYPNLSLQHEIDPPLSSFLLFRAFLAKERNLMHQNIVLRVSCLLQRAATHLLRIFKGTYSFHDRERYNQITWPLSRIRVLRHDERRLI